MSWRGSRRCGALCVPAPRWFKAVIISAGYLVMERLATVRPADPPYALCHCAGNMVHCSRVLTEFVFWTGDLCRCLTASPEFYTPLANYKGPRESQGRGSDVISPPNPRGLWQTTS